MAVVQLLVKAYAINIIRYGNRRFETIPPEYHEPVKEYAAVYFELSDIDKALANEYITEQEYTEILGYRKGTQPIE